MENTFYFYMSMSSREVIAAPDLVPCGLTITDDALDIVIDIVRGVGAYVVSAQSDDEFAGLLERLAEPDLFHNTPAYISTNVEYDVFTSAVQMFIDKINEVTADEFDPYGWMDDEHEPY